MCMSGVVVFYLPMNEKELNIKTLRRVDFCKSIHTRKNGDGGVGKNSAIDVLMVSMAGNGNDDGIVYYPPVLEHIHSEHLMLQHKSKDVDEKKRKQQQQQQQERIIWNKIKESSKENTYGHI